MTDPQFATLVGSAVGAGVSAAVAVWKLIKPIAKNLGVNDPRTPEVGSTVNLIAGTVTRIERKTDDVQRTLDDHGNRIRRLEAAHPDICGTGG